MIALRALGGFDIDALEVVIITSYKHDTYLTENKYPKKNYLPKTFTALERQKIVPQLDQISQ